MKKIMILIFVFLLIETNAQELNKRPSYGVKAWANSIGQAMRSELTHSEVIKYPPIIQITNNGINWKIGTKEYRFPYKYYDKNEKVYIFSDEEINELTIPSRISCTIMEDNGSTIISIMDPNKNDIYGKVYAEMYVFEVTINKLFVDYSSKQFFGY